MGSRRKASDSSRTPMPSRRDVLGAAASTPAVAVTPTSLPKPQADDLPARCAEWLALDSEIDRLTLRWATLESQAIRDFDWFNLTPAQCRALPIGAEMHAIDARLKALFKARHRSLAALKRLKPTDARGATNKLVVAARLTQHDGGEVHAFLVEVLAVLTALNCPSCEGLRMLSLGGPSEGPLLGRTNNR